MPEIHSSTGYKLLVPPFMYIFHQWITEALADGTANPRVYVVSSVIESCIESSTTSQEVREKTDDTSSQERPHVLRSCICVLMYEIESMRLRNGTFCEEIHALDTDLRPKNERRVLVFQFSQCSSCMYVLYVRYSSIVCNGFEPSRLTRLSILSFMGMPHSS